MSISWGKLLKYFLDNPYIKVMLKSSMIMSILLFNFVNFCCMHFMHFETVTMLLSTHKNDVSGSSWISI